MDEENILSKRDYYFAMFGNYTFEEKDIETFTNPYFKIREQNTSKFIYTKATKLLNGLMSGEPFIVHKIMNRKIYFMKIMKNSKILVLMSWRFDNPTWVPTRVVNK